MHSFFFPKIFWVCFFPIKVTDFSFLAAHLALRFPRYMEVEVKLSKYGSVSNLTPSKSRLQGSTGPFLWIYNIGSQRSNVNFNPTNNLFIFYRFPGSPGFYCAQDLLSQFQNSSDPFYPRISGTGNISLPSS